jgi:hypothetical protein
MSCLKLSRRDGELKDSLLLFGGGFDEELCGSSLKPKAFTKR